MEAVKIAEDIYWVGAIDWNARTFHGYATPRGTSYNSYLIIDEKITLIDAVKAPFINQLVSRIRSVIDPKDIDIIISNHSENDHSSGLQIMQQMTGAPIYASRKGSEHLPLNFGPMNVVKVADGEEMSIGKRTLKFIETPMLHWPDSMMTYCKEDRILFSMDGFGQHFASSRRFDDEVDAPTLFDEAAKYYANILMPFGSQYQSALEKVKGLDIKMLATAHGIIWRTMIGEILARYSAWSNHETKKKVVVIYDTMWGSTEMMAQSIVEGVASEGVDVQLCKVSTMDRSQIMREILDAKAVVLGTPTMNMGIFPTMADTAWYIKGLKPKNRYGAVFGSYGWASAGTKALKEVLVNSGLEFVFEDIDIRFNPMEEGRKRCFEFGRTIAKKVMS